MTVRLSPDTDADLKDIAAEEEIPPAILARNWITSEIKRRKARRAHSPDEPADDDTPA